MDDNDCVRFLQWALPQLQMRWSGFRRVRNQVCQRLARRLKELGLCDVDAYRHYLLAHAAEWQHLDTLCRVVVTRFYRDKAVFAELAATVLPQLADSAIAHGRQRLRLWSIGSASGEEPYTIAILWQQRLAPRFPHLQFSILATEIDPYLLARSHHACYPFAALKNLSEEMRASAFTRAGDSYCLKPDYHAVVAFRQQDIRTTLPDEHFDLILCRNLVFTYFDESLQRQILQQLLRRLRPKGWLLLGVHETLPAGEHGLQAMTERLGFYQRSDTPHLARPGCATAPGQGACDA